MSQPGKSASRPLMSIEETIHRRLSVNIEFKYWVSKFGIIACMNGADWLNFRRMMKCDQRQEEEVRPLILNIKEPVERVNIKKYVGEFY